MGAKAGITLSLPSGRFGNTVTPKLGQRGDRRSVRSSESIGKFDRIPPSTRVDVNSPEPVSVTGRKKNRIAIDARTASAIVRRVEPDHSGSPMAAAPIARRHVGDRDDQLVSMLGGQAVVGWPDRRNVCTPRFSWLRSRAVVALVSAVPVAPPTTPSTGRRSRAGVGELV
jgi:hypothetical protein